MICHSKVEWVEKPFQLKLKNKLWWLVLNCGIKARQIIRRRSGTYHTIRFPLFVDERARKANRGGTKRELCGIILKMAGGTITMYEVNIIKQVKAISLSRRV